MQEGSGVKLHILCFLFYLLRYRISAVCYCSIMEFQNTKRHYCQFPESDYNFIRQSAIFLKPIKVFFLSTTCHRLLCSNSVRVHVGQEVASSKIRIVVCQLLAKFQLRRDLMVPEHTLEFCLRKLSKQYQALQHLLTKFFSILIFLIISVNIPSCFIKNLTLSLLLEMIYTVSAAFQSRIFDVHIKFQQNCKGNYFSTSQHSHRE